MTTLGQLIGEAVKRGISIPQNIAKNICPERREANPHAPRKIKKPRQTANPTQKIPKTIVSARIHYIRHTYCNDERIQCCLICGSGNLEHTINTRSVNAHGHEHRSEKAVCKNCGESFFTYYDSE